MTTYVGLNTINQPKKFTLTDFDLIKRDLLNAFMIREGQLPGRPELGTKIWNFIFEPMTGEVRTAIETEVKRVILLDPRLLISSIIIASNQNTVTIKAAVSLLPDMTPEILVIQFNESSHSADIL